MRRDVLIGAPLLLLLAGSADAGPWEDGMALYNRGDYVPAIRLFRSLAREGNATAQTQLGLMYRSGRGVRRNLRQAQMWFGVAAASGSPEAKAEWDRLARKLGPAQTEKARDMAQTCAASNYQNCEF